MNSAGTDTRFGPTLGGPLQDEVAIILPCTPAPSPEVHRLQQVPLGSCCHRLGPGVDAQLVEDRGEVVVHRGGADDESLGDPLVWEVLPPVLAELRCWRLCPPSVDAPMDQA